MALFRPVTKLSIRVTQPARIPDMLRLAFRTAMTGRRGPVFVDIPRDVLNDQVVRMERPRPRGVPTDPPRTASSGGGPRGRAPPRAGRAPAPDRRGRRDLGGGGGSRHPPLRRPRAPGHHRLRPERRRAATTTPLYVGPLGRAGSPEAAQACRRADLLLVVGSRLGQFTSFYDGRYIQPGTAIVQVDVDSRDIGRVYPVAVGIQADARETLGRPPGGARARRGRRDLRGLAGRDPGAPGPATGAASRRGRARRPCP